MKYNKFLLLTCLSLLMIACSDDDEKTNTTSATIQFEERELEIKESANLVQIPLVITGETNGTIQIKVTMKENSSNFKLDEDIIITSEYITVPAGVETVNFETRLIVENIEMEMGRYITFEIEEVKGATKGANTTCTLNIEENNLLEGTYTMSGYNVFDMATTQMTVKIEAVEGSDDKLKVDFGYGGTATMEYWESDEPGVYYLEMSAL
ncbi:MAG: hypothetical protein LUF85_17905 [Bacteroides sp.]|nr:hypothetical protein [Bacteroides sp.]